LLWTVEQLVTYLRTGFDAAHGTAAGTMAAVAHNLATVPELEVNAIAVYIAARMGASAGARATAAGNAPGGQGAAGASARGEDAPTDARHGNDGDAIYRTACADCHDGGQRAIALAYSTSVTDTTPANLIRVTLDGIHPREGETGEVMPAFRGALDDTQLASLIAFLRARFSHAPPWQDIGGEVAKAKRERESEDRKSS
jgi:mono/diheme cytochrome c family protein